MNPFLQAALTQPLREGYTRHATVLLMPLVQIDSRKKVMRLNSFNSHDSEAEIIQSARKEMHFAAYNFVLQKYIHLLTWFHY